MRSIEVECSGGRKYNTVVDIVSNLYMISAFTHNTIVIVILVFYSTQLL